MTKHLSAFPAHLFHPTLPCPDPKALMSKPACSESCDTQPAPYVLDIGGPIWAPLLHPWGAQGCSPKGPLGAPAWILLLCWGLAAHCTGAMALPPPSITILRMPAEPPHPGESVTVSCEALSGLPELTLLYWLENGSFVESLHPDGAVHEGTVQEELQGSGLALHRDLHFSSFDTQHLHTNFTCVVLSPLGVDTREVRWPSPALAPVTGVTAQSAGLG